MQKLLKWLPVVLMGAFFLITVILSHMGFVRLNQVLFFPLDSGAGFNGEQRLIRRYTDRETRITQTLRELMLGPAELGFENIVPLGTKIQSLMLRDNVLYLDFSRHFFNDMKGLSLPAQERVDYIEKNLLFNYPFIDQVMITVNGQLPFSPYYRIEENLNPLNS